MQPLRNWLIVGGIFAVVLIGGAWIILRPLHQDQAIVDAHATKIVDLPSSVAGDAFGQAGYHWLDAHTVLFHEPSSDYALDVTTGTQSVPPGITKALALVGKNASTGLYGWTVSPDGKWAVASVSPQTASTTSSPPAGSNPLAAVLGGRGGPAAGSVAWPSTNGHLILTRLDGGKTFDLGPSQGLLSETAWRLDSKGWFQISMAVDESGVVSEWSMGGAKPTNKVLETSSKIIPTGVIGAMSNASLLSAGAGDDEDDSETPTSKAYNVVHFDKGREVVDTSYSYPLSQTTIPVSHDLSPDRKHIVWSCIKTPGLSGIIMQMAFQQSPFQQEIEVGNVDGSGMRVLMKGSNGNMSGPTGARWMPDGHHISYIDHGALWSTPVD